MTPTTIQYPFSFDVLEFCTFTNNQDQRSLQKYSSIIKRFLHDMKEEGKYDTTCFDDDCIESWVQNNLTNQTSLYVKDFSKR